MSVTSVAARCDRLHAIRAEAHPHRADTLRFVLTTHALDTFTSGDVEVVRALADAVEARTGVVQFNDETWAGLAGHSVLGDRGFLVRDGDGAAVAYAHLAHHHAGEWSLEVAALDGGSEVRSRLVHDAVETVAAQGGGHLTLWAHGATDDDDALATAAGFAHERDLLQLRVPLPLASAPAWPAGISVRDFEPGRDAEAWLVVNNRAFAGHAEQGGWTRATLASMTEAELRAALELAWRRGAASSRRVRRALAPRRR